MMNHEKTHTIPVGVNCVVWKNDSCKMSCKVHMYRQILTVKVSCVCNKEVNRQIYRIC